MGMDGRDTCRPPVASGGGGIAGIVGGGVTIVAATVVANYCDTIATEATRAADVEGEAVEGHPRGV